MAHLVDKVHLLDKQKLERVESAIMLGAIVSGLAVCVIGAAIFDVGRILSIW